MDLNENQKEAAFHKNGPMIVLAGPGSGKTTVIITRVKNLIEEFSVSPKDILVISFTKASAEEMKTRFHRLTEDKYSVSFSTFHAFFYRVIKVQKGEAAREYSIITENEKRRAIAEAATAQHVCFDSNDGLISEIERIKNDLLPLENFRSRECSSEDFIKIYNAYENYKKERKYLDFDDMLVFCYDIFKNDSEALEYWKNRYKYILIDEFQDINRAQYEIVRLLGGRNGNVFAVGDDDQSIYNFRGASPEFMLNFADDFDNAKKVKLAVNYRSTDEIINLSNTIISDNKRRYEKNIVGTGKSGKRPVILKFDDQNSEAAGIADKIKKLWRKGKAYGNIAVIFRANYQARPFVSAFIKSGIPYQLKDGLTNIFEHKIWKDLLSYFRLAADINDDEAFKNIANKPSRYIKKINIEDALNGRNGGALINNLLKSRKVTTYARENIQELKYMLEVLKNKKRPADAIRYIRQTIGYDNYTRSYADFMHVEPNHYYAVTDEIEAAAEEFDTFDDFYAYTITYAEEIKKNTNTLKPLSKDKVVLTTMHSAKGLEFDAVFVVSVVDGIVPYEYAVTAAEKEEERRLLYVALTRAKELLYVSVFFNLYGKDASPSVFLKKYMPKSRL